MERTTVMIPEGLKSKAMKLAQGRGISFSELVRESLESQVKEKDPGQRDPLFSDQAFFDGQAHEDISLNHDQYLYDYKS